jgi:hypothetical protein
MMKKKSFIISTPEVNVTKLIFFVKDKGAKKARPFVSGTLF